MRGEIDAFHAQEHAGLVPYRSLQFANNKQPLCAVLKSDPPYLGRSVYDFPDLVVPPRELGPDGQPLDPNAPQLKDFQLTGLNWLAYCWSKSENGILADEVSLVSAKEYLTLSDC